MALNNVRKVKRRESTCNYSLEGGLGALLEGSWHMHFSSVCRRLSRCEIRHSSRGDRSGWHSSYRRFLKVCGT